MYYALTIIDNIITGVHESMTPYTSSTFVEHPRFASHQVVTIQDPMQFQTGVDIRAYNEDGTMKDEVWCIEQGYMPMPDGYEIVDGVLVKKEISEAEVPLTWKQFLANETARIEEEANKKTLAMKPLLTELVKGKSADIVIGSSDFILDWVEGSYILDDVRMWNGQPKRCCQAHNSTGNPTWTPDVASLWAPFHATKASLALPWVSPTGAHDMYKKGEWMKYTDDFVYECLEDTDRDPATLPAKWHKYSSDDSPIEEEPVEPPVNPEEPGPAPEPEPEEQNSNGTEIWSEWRPWTSGLNSDLYQIGDRVAQNGLRYIATIGNNHWEPAGGTGWQLA